MTTRVLPAIRDMRRRSSRAKSSFASRSGSCGASPSGPPAPPGVRRSRWSSCSACSLSVPHPLVRRAEPLEELADRLVLGRDRIVAFDLLASSCSRCDRRSSRLAASRRSSASRWPRRWWRNDRAPEASEQPGVDVRGRRRARFPIAGEVRLDLPHDGRRRLQLGEQGQELVVPLGEQPADDLGLGRFRLAFVLALDGSEQVAHQAERQLGGGERDEPRLALADLLLERSSIRRLRSSRASPSAGRPPPGTPHPAARIPTLVLSRTFSCSLRAVFRAAISAVSRPRSRVRGRRDPRAAWRPRRRGGQPRFEDGGVGDQALGDVEAQQRLDGRPQHLAAGLVLGERSDLLRVEEEELRDLQREEVLDELAPVLRVPAIGQAIERHLELLPHLACPARSSTG